MREFHWLAIYDICDPKRLIKVAKLMEKFGKRVQYSAFEMYSSEAVVTDLIRKIKQVINHQQDYIVVFKLCQKDWQKQEKYGRGNYLVDDDKQFEIL